MEQIRRLLACAIGLSTYFAYGAFPSSIATETIAPTPGVGLTRSLGNHLFVHVLINDHPAWFVVDTGAALSIVDTAKAKALGLPVGGSVYLPKQIEVNSRVVPVAFVKALRIGSRDLGPGPVALTDLREFHTQLKGSDNAVNMDGIIGLDILQWTKAVIDCRNQRIYFEGTGDHSGKDAVQAARRNGSHRVPLGITKSGALEVEGRIAQFTYSFVVDTGGFATLLPLQVARETGVAIVGTTANAKGIHSRARPVGVAVASEVALGKYSLGPMVVGVTGLPNGPDDLTHPFGGLLGADFLIGHNAIIDVGNKVIYFR
jgi:predicted aspartyl protease